MKTKTLLLDLDHTIIQPAGNRKFPKDEDDWEFVPGMPEKLAEYAKAGYRMFIASNQGGIAQGHTTADAFIAKANKIMKTLNDAGASFVNCAFCSSMLDSDPCRKPNPGMFAMLSKEYKIDEDEATMVGDMDTDEGFAKNAGIKFMYVNDFLKSKPI